LPLSRKLRFASQASETCEEKETPYVKAGYYLISDGRYFPGTEDDPIINLEDSRNTQHHADKARLTGCCGPSGTKGPNVVCSNGHEVATESSDCWSAHALIFRLEAIRLDLVEEE
jgi:hypothetical protein